MRKLLLVAFVACLASSARALTGEEACDFFEKLGNKHPTQQQDCRYQTLPSGKGSYMLWFKGDYGADYLDIAANGLGALMETDQNVSTPTSSVLVTFPAIKTRLGTNFTAQLNMSDIRACLRQGDQKKRIPCLKEKISAAAKATEKETENLNR